MKTRQVPVVITLLAGLVTSVAGIILHMEAERFVKTLLIVLVSFYILGCIAKIVLDKNFKEEVSEKATDEAAEDQAEADSRKRTPEEAEEESEEEK